MVLDVGFQEISIPGNILCMREAFRFEAAKGSCMIGGHCIVCVCTGLGWVEKSPYSVRRNRKDLFRRVGVGNIPIA